MAQEKITETTAADGREAFQKEMIFPIGEPNTAYAQYFIGNSYLAPISKEQIPFNNVTFEPGCRNNWHIHHATKGGGQMLVCVAGWGNNIKNAWASVPQLPAVFRRSDALLFLEHPAEMLGIFEAEAV